MWLQLKLLLHFHPRALRGMGSREQEGSEASFGTTAFAKTKPISLLQWHI